eukprot:TRINITY_DN42788_c0_g1_i1.p1 TRINITY_DN42788_c0_g1~~TRINITY_DN42788_c0_g1_i1.p1  ORF type:complete len:496 (-),score=67.84 TRINITY_DN42788_c0_g1_i1:66-1418(-)
MSAAASDVPANSNGSSGSDQCLPPLRKSRRILDTDAPCIVGMQKMLRGKTGLLSLAQGVVHWSPPAAAIKAASEVVMDNSVNQYGADSGDADLIEALKVKLAQKNGLEGQCVMVTAGANQAFVNLVLTLCDANDSAVLFAPYYFNHMMALQMSSVKPLVGPCSPESMLPDVDWLRDQFRAGTNIRMVVVCNPCNPTGAVAPREFLEPLSDVCRAHGCWLVMDNTYEDFTYRNELPRSEKSQPTEAILAEKAVTTLSSQESQVALHSCVSGAHVVNVFSFSKAYGMMGWRVGYLAYSSNNGLDEQLLKAQDTIPICPNRLSQRVALAALQEAGSAWVAERISESVVVNREVVSTAIIRALGRKAILGNPQGAIYLFIKLPLSSMGKVADDAEATEYLAEHHRIVVIPGGSCGAPGCIRVSFANAAPDVCRAAAARLEAGLVAWRDRVASAS